jgi:hypothetical protein
MCGDIPPLPHTSWRGAQLGPGVNFTFTFTINEIVQERKKNTTFGIKTTTYASDQVPVSTAENELHISVHLLNTKLHKNTT